MSELQQNLQNALVGLSQPQLEKGSKARILSFIYT